MRRDAVQAKRRTAGVAPEEPRHMEEVVGDDGPTPPVRPVLHDLLGREHPNFERTPNVRCSKET